LANGVQNGQDETRIQPRTKEKLLTVTLLLRQEIFAPLAANRRPLPWLSPAIIPDFEMQTLKKLAIFPSFPIVCRKEVLD
jgi:hypothetical protein